MFANSFALVGDSASTRTYDLVSIENGKSIRKNAAAAANELESITVSHTASLNKEGTVVKRHLARLDLWKVNSTTQKLQKAAVYVVIEQPVDSVITAAILKDMRTQLKNFLDDANVAKLINDEP
jgi:hypothetical protein